MKMTENMKMVVKGLQKGTMTGKELALACNTTTNRVIATIHSKNNLVNFNIETKQVNDKLVKVYSLNEKGLELLDNLENDNQVEKDN